MSNSPKITIRSENLREAVENRLNIYTDDDKWRECEALAREKLERLKARNPEVIYYDDKYLVILAAEIYQQRAQAAEINASALGKYERRKSIEKAH